MRRYANNLLLLLVAAFRHHFVQSFAPSSRSSHPRHPPVFAPKKNPLSTHGETAPLKLSIGSHAPVTLAAKAGLSAAALQWILARIVFTNQIFPRALRDTADYTAHSVVALGLMALLSSLGIFHWWVHPSACGSKLLEFSAIGQWMAAVVLGSFALWDIPTSFRVAALRKPDVIIHHCVMMVLALIGCTVLPMPYIVYYFGVVELSSIPLILYDQVAHWREQSTGEQDTTSPHPLEKIQASLGAIAAVAFTSVRVTSFTKVTLRNFLPDCVQALAKTAAISRPQKWAIRFLMFACGGFTALQWYWFSQMVTAFQKGEV